MILLVSDLHTRFELVNHQIEHAEGRTREPVDAVVILGDVGLMEPQLRRFFRKRGERFRRRTYFVEGNHEDFEALPGLIERYADVMTFLPRGWAGEIAGWNCLALGGSAYMDSLTTPRPAVVSDRDIERCLAHAPAAVDLVLAHDCPSGIGVPSAPGFEHIGPPGIPQGGRLVDHFRPRVWVFGHHHQWFDLARNNTRFFGLPQAWEGYALLLADGSIVAMPHEVPPAASIPFLSRLRRRFTGRGDQP